MPDPKTKRRPPRRVKGDIVSADANRVQVAISHSCAAFDAMAHKMDRKWGIDRLPELVEPEMAERYGSALGRLNEAIREDNAQEVAICVQVCLRGLTALDEAAMSKQAPLADPSVIECEYQGFKFGIMTEGRYWQAVKEARPDLTVFTLEEIGAALQAMRLDHPLIRTAKEIGGSEIQSISEKLPKDFLKAGGDSIPFGEPTQ